MREPAAGIGEGGVDDALIGRQIRIPDGQIDGIHRFLSISCRNHLCQFAIEHIALCHKAHLRCHSRRSLIPIPSCNNLSLPRNPCIPGRVVAKASVSF